MGDVCRRCKAPIVWATTAAGVPMPLDPTPTVDGNVAVTHTGSGAPVATVLKRAELERLAGEHELYVAHFASCPYADEFRRPR